MSDARAIGIDIGGTKIAIAAVDGAAQIVARESIATEAERGFGRAVERMSRVIDRLLSQAGWPRESLAGIGVGCAGPVYPATGIIDNPHTLATWSNCDIVSALRGVFNCPVFLENDADAAALGEWFAGAARGSQSAVMLTLGTGVGGGVVLDGAIYRGARGEHPELGHIPIDPSGPECYCGTRGCLESIASGTAIAAAGAEFGLPDSRAVFAAAADGHSAANQILARVDSALVMATWTILHTFMPERIVLGGGIISDHFARFAAPMRAAIPLATMVPKGAVEIVPAQLANDAGTLGAARLALADAP